MGFTKVCEIEGDCLNRGVSKKGYADLSSLGRHWTKGDSECHNRRVLIRLQGRAVRLEH